MTDERKAEVIDLTPTWEGLLPALITVVENGTAQGRAEALGELLRMARSADAYVARFKAESQ